LGVTLQSVQQLTGVNVFFYYGATIFQSVGISDSFITQIILGVWPRLDVVHPPR
jgi:SP family sugar:H+ symporter-like MFS transporter